MREGGVKGYRNVVNTRRLERIGHDNEIRVTRGFSGASGSKGSHRHEPAGGEAEEEEGRQRPVLLSRTEVSSGSPARLPDGPEAGGSVE